ncbi:hypothetical protein [Streptosporangium canum]|uniref:hypothetical protein n=1 Tax=Streptosporangium canum TaxID=324952 RepID=UPI0037BB4B26
MVAIHLENPCPCTWILMSVYLEFSVSVHTMGHAPIGDYRPDGERLVLMIVIGAAGVTWT